MADSLSLLIKSAFDASGVTAATNSINRIDRQISGVSRTMTKFMGLFAAGGAISSIVAFGVSAVKSYAESEKGVAKLTQAMRNLGSYSPAALQDQLDYAASLQKTTKYTDEQVVAVQTSLTTFGLYGAQLKAATMATLDLATQTGDAEAAAKLVGKAYQGQTDSLGKMGIKISDTLVGAKKFTAVLAEVQRRFGGMAEAEGKTFAGQLEIIKNGFDNLKESLGSKLMPVANETLDWFRDLDTVLGYVMEKFQKSPRTLADVDKEIKQLQKAFKDSGNSNGMIYVGPLQRVSIEEASARMKALVAEQKRLKAEAAGPAAGASGPSRGPAPEAELDNQTASWLLNERNQLMMDYYRRHAISQKKFNRDSNLTEQERARENKKILRDIEAEWLAGSKTISGGFEQAFMEMSASASNWRDNWVGVVNGAMGPSKAAVHDFFTSTSDQFLNLGSLAAGVFDGIKRAFLSMLEEMAAKAAIYGFLNLMSGGSLSGVTSLGKFLGFAKGGYTGDGNPNEVAGFVHKRELVLNEGETAAVRSGRAVIGAAPAMGGSGGPSLTIHQNITAGPGTDVKAIFKAAAEGARKGVTEFVDFSKVTFKIGERRSGETAL